MSYLNQPSRLPRGVTHGLAPGVFLLLVVIGIGVAIGIPLGEHRLDGWGSWLGVFIAGIALVASAYAVMIQARQGESGAWNIALSRLGEIYDSALSEEWMCDILSEEVDSDGNIFISNFKPTAREKIWFGSLFMAYEQVFVASRGLSGESQRVWRRYLRNQLNKPTIRAAFILDSVGPDGCAGAKDYHHDFWRFVRGRQSCWSCFQKLPTYRDYAIHPSFFPGPDSEEVNQKPLPLIDVSYHPFRDEDVDFWIECYDDPELSAQMYAIPEGREAATAYLSKGKRAFTVYHGEERIGGFTVSGVSEQIGTFGFFLSKDFRGMGLGKNILQFAEEEAAKHGYLTLRADVYTDNLRSIRTLESRGFRSFIWFEKNLKQSEE